MDHIGVLKRAWDVTWRYKILWLFGLFAGGVGSTGGGAGNYSFTEEDFDVSPGDLDRIGWWVQDNIALLVAVAAVLLFIGLALFVISIAAKGGLVHLVNEAEEGRPVRGLEGWSAGFRSWLRVFGIGFVVFTPIVILSMLLFVAVLAPILAPLFAGDTPGPEAVFALCGGVLFGGLLLLIGGIIAGLLDTLGVRHAVLSGTGVFRSIGAAWTDIRTRFKDVAILWLLMFAVGIAFGIAVSVIATMFAFGIALATLGGSWVAAAAVGFVMFVVLLLPAAVYSAFSSAVWTVFYRRLTGLEMAEKPQASGYPVAPGYAPPPAPPPPGAPGLPLAPPPAPPLAPPPAPPRPPE